MAQCVPRLIGESQAGSWPTHTPFCTSAITVQPTEQWVQMFLMRWIGCWRFATPVAAPEACAMRGARPASAATPAAPSPACLKKERRSSPPEDSPS